MAGEVRAVVMARTTWSGPTPMDSEHTREGCSLSRMREEGSLREGLLASERQQREWKRKERRETPERQERHKTQGW